MTFAGFTPPVDDYFRMPNEWINICAKIDSLSELKVVQYVLRHTWGYQGFSGARKITIDEFMHGRKRKDGSRIDDGTGLSKQSVITAVEAAITHGYLVCDLDKKDLARQKKYYQLAMRTDVKPLDSTSDVKYLDIQLDVKNLDISDVKDLDHEVKGLDSSGQEFRQRSEKDNLERHLQKDSKNTGDTALDAPMPARASSLSQQIDKRLSDPRLTAITADMLKDRKEQSHADDWQASPVADEEDELEKTVKRPAVRVAPPPEQTVRGATDLPVLLTGGAAALSPSAGTLPPRASVQGESRALGAKPSVNKTSTVAKVPKRPKTETPEPKGPPHMPAEDAPWTTRTCLQLFDAWRGAYLIGKFELMQASSCAKEMVAQYSRAEVTEAKTRMDKDKYWIERGGADVCNVAKQIHRYARRGKTSVREQEKAAVSGGSIYEPTSWDIYKGNSVEERAALAAYADTVPDSFWE